MLGKVKNYLSNTKNIVNLVLISLFALLIYNYIFWKPTIWVICFDFLIPLIYFLALKFYKKSNLKVLNIIFSIWATIFCLKDFGFIKFSLEYGYYHLFIQALLPKVLFAFFTIITLWCPLVKFFKNNKTKKVISVFTIIVTAYYILYILSGLMNFNFIDFLFDTISSVYKISMVIYLKQYAMYKIGDVKNE